MMLRMRRGRRRGPPGRAPTRTRGSSASVFFFQAEDGIRDLTVTGVQTCALPILVGTEWAEAQVDTIRLRLLKIAAQVRITARRIWIRFSRAYPWQNLFAAACKIGRASCRERV